jgi:hypothetical protein
MVHVEEIGANGVDLEPDESSEGQESELPPGYSLSPFDDGGLDNEMAVLGRVPLAEVSVLDEIRRRAEVLEHDDDVFPATQLEEVYAVVSWQSESEFLSAVENSMTAVNIICPRLCEAHVSGPQLVLDLFHEAVIEGRFQSVVGFQEKRTWFDESPSARVCRFGPLESRVHCRSKSTGRPERQGHFCCC